MKKLTRKQKNSIKTIIKKNIENFVFEKRLNTNTKNFKKMVIPVLEAIVENFNLKNYELECKTQVMNNGLNKGIIGKFTFISSIETYSFAFTLEPITINL